MTALLQDELAPPSWLMRDCGDRQRQELATEPVVALADFPGIFLSLRLGFWLLSVGCDADPVQPCFVRHRFRVPFPGQGGVGHCEGKVFGHVVPAGVFTDPEPGFPGGAEPAGGHRFLDGFQPDFGDVQEFFALVFTQRGHGCVWTELSVAGVG